MADKVDEVVAIPQPLALLDLTGAVVTIDAAGCQREVAKAVVDGGGDYVLPVKGNQKALLAKAATLMADLALDHAKGTPGTPVDFAGASDDGHGRLKTRRTWVTADVGWLGAGLLAKWTGLASVALVERTRQDPGDLTGKVTVERQVYVTSLKAPAAAPVATLVRGHWAVENNLHWQLDVSFAEDQRRVRVGHGAENFSRLCRIGLNLLERDTTVKAGIKAERLLAGWDHDFLLHLICQ